MADLTFYYGLFGGWALAAAGLELGSRFGKKASAMVTTDLFKAFRNNYLLVYSLMMGTIVTVSPSCARPTHHSGRLAARPIRLRPLPPLWL